MKAIDAEWIMNNPAATDEDRLAAAKYFRRRLRSGMITLERSLAMFGSVVTPGSEAYDEYRQAVVSMRRTIDAMAEIWPELEADWADLARRGDALARKIDRA